MNDKPISSISEYIDIIIKLRSKIEVNLKRNEMLLFRGQNNRNFSLLPSLARKVENSNDKTFVEEERNMIESMKYRLPSIFNDNLKPLELLALLQHHGIPTRLLDVTENALVALYFACSGNVDEDGEVIVFKINDNKVATYPIVQGLCETYKFANSSLSKLSVFFSNITNQPYFLEQRNTVKKYKTPQEKEEWLSEVCKIAIVVQSPIRSERQRVQQGRYILFTNSIKEKETDGKKRLFFTNSIDPIEKTDNIVEKRIIVSKKEKKKILKDLETLGISKEQLFPDSVDYIAGSITERFKERIMNKNKNL